MSIFKSPEEKAKIREREHKQKRREEVSLESALKELIEGPAKGIHDITAYSAVQLVAEKLIEVDAQSRVILEQNKVLAEQNTLILEQLKQQGELLKKFLPSINQSR